MLQYAHIKLKTSYVSAYAVHSQQHSNLDVVLNILYRFENLLFPVYENTLKIFYHNYDIFYLK